MEIKRLKLNFPALFLAILQYLYKAVQVHPAGVLGVLPVSIFPQTYPELCRRGLLQKYPFLSCSEEFFYGG